MGNFNYGRVVGNAEKNGNEICKVPVLSLQRTDLWIRARVCV